MLGLGSNDSFVDSHLEYMGYKKQSIKRLFTLVRSNVIIPPPVRLDHRRSLEPKRSLSRRYIACYRTASQPNVRPRSNGKQDIDPRKARSHLVPLQSRRVSRRMPQTNDKYVILRYEDTVWGTSTVQKRPGYDH